MLELRWLASERWPLDRIVELLFLLVWGTKMPLQVSGPLMVYGFSNGPATQPIVHMDNLVHHNKTSTYTVARLSKRNSLASNYH